MQRAMFARLKVQGAFGLSLMLAACAPPGPEVRGGGASPAPPGPAVSGGAYRPPQTPASRMTPIVAGRPARVFIFAGVDDACHALPAPQVTVTRAPAKGEVLFRPGQETTLAASVGGRCIGSKATGTGIYYTARPGASGPDSFAVTATLSSGETMTRDFTIEIAE